MTQLSRSRFVQSATLASASMVLDGAQASGKVIGANDRLRIAVVGLNGRGKSHVGPPIRCREESPYRELGQQSELVDERRESKGIPGPRTRSRLKALSCNGRILK